MGLLSTLVLARLLVPADFGLVAIATTMLAVLQTITNMSLGQALIHHPDPTTDHFHAAWTLNALRGLVVGGLFAAAGQPIAVFYGDARLAPVVAVLGASVFLNGLMNPKRIMLQKKLVFWQDFVLTVSAKLVGLIVSVWLAFATKSYWALVWGQVAAQGTSVLVSYMVLPMLPRPRWRASRELFGFSAWLTLSQIVNTINWRFDQLLIGKFLGRSDLGLYTVGDNLALMPTREATLPLTQTLFPAYANVRDDRKRLLRAYQRSQALVTAIALPLGVGMALLAKPLVLIAMGPKWLGAVVVIQALAAIFALQTLGTLVQPLGMSLGATRRLFKRDVMLLVVRVPIIVAGMFLHGLIGVVIARVITGIIAIGFNLTLVRSLLGLPIVEQIRANARTLFAVAVMAAMLTAWHLLLSEPEDQTALIAATAVQIALGGAAYLGTLATTWWLQSRPAGPETEVAAMLGKLHMRWQGARG
ncbi:lipopolysaccharide biosynthesis protein [Stakelama saccharophila]|uniref:Lipopolysaccharide biosynthesis protein n=1 Tax=Stakelama saccharophila TaxID=3075605 RepID=A0ABZ0BDV5_9SPHN|nr:lipopolysaccharide biosynthesis protein [Stakelama sp. W311]WNO54519.1 lipopolysaccharide biosynthesis protein [Stakelama sp. W311]